MDETWHDMYLARLGELKSQYILHVANGQAPDYSEYKKICGAVEGIAICEREFKELIARMEGNDASDDGFSDLPVVDQQSQ